MGGTPASEKYFREREKNTYFPQYFRQRNTRPRRVPRLVHRLYHTPGARQTTTTYDTQLTHQLLQEGTDDPHAAFPPQQEKATSFLITPPEEKHRSPRTPQNEPP